MPLLLSVPVLLILCNKLPEHTTALISYYILMWIAIVYAVKNYIPANWTSPLTASLNALFAVGGLLLVHNCCGLPELTQTLQIDYLGIYLILGICVCIGCFTDPSFINVPVALLLLFTTIVTHPLLYKEHTQEKTTADPTPTATVSYTSKPSFSSKQSKVINISIERPDYGYYYEDEPCREECCRPKRRRTPRHHGSRNHRHH